MATIISTLSLDIQVKVIESMTHKDLTSLLRVEPNLQMNEALIGLRPPSLKVVESP